MRFPGDQSPADHINDQPFSGRQGTAEIAYRGSMLETAVRLTPGTHWQNSRTDHYTSLIEGLFLPPFLNTLARGNGT